MFGTNQSLNTSGYPENSS